MVADHISLQINLSPGDVAYAAQTVPALAGHHKNISKRLLIVDCCRPQRTKLLDPDKKFPLPAFNEQVATIVAISEKLLKDGIVSDLLFLWPGDELFSRISANYLNGVYDCTHGAGGTANMGYW